MIEQLPPQNIDAEEAILGGILLDPEAMARIESGLHPEAFYVNAHQDIYQAALELYAQGQPTDLMTVANWLNDRHLLEKIGGTSKLTQLVSRTICSVNIDKYAELIMDKYIRRKLISTGNEVIELGYDNSIDLDSVIEQSEQKIFSLSNTCLVSNTEHNSSIALAAVYELAETSPIYPTGLIDLDQLMVGFEAGTLTLVAGRPSMGKTAISLFLTLQMMQLHELPVIFFSLEMTKKQLEYRLWSLISVLECYQHLNLIPLRSDRLRQHRAGLKRISGCELNTIEKIVDIASRMPLYINDNRAISVSGIASVCRQIMAKEGKIGLIVVDYLQMMATESNGNRSYELGDVARGLYKIAGELNIPILALSQISRAVEARNNKRPMMSDLSQSGVLEMVADNIILSYRDEYYNRDTPDQGILELIMAKARHGDTGQAKFLFDKSYGILRNLA